MFNSKILSITCVVIDDDEINRLALEHYIKMHDQLTLVDSFADGMQALSFFQGGGQADLVLLDIEMPHLSGLEFMRLLPELKSSVVLVTSHPKFAVDAFELRVTDYLVKPLQYARFCQAINRVTERLQAISPAPTNTASVSKAEGDTGTNMFLKVNGKFIRIDFNEVLYIEALSTYVVVVTAKQKYIVTGTLKSIEERLPFKYFVRVHRSYIVNLHRVDAMQDNQLQIGNYEVPVGKSYQEDFSQRLRIF
jgi:two-component system LytT family response regulator